jgi:hypothetical protein
MAYRDELTALRDRVDNVRVDILDLEAELESVRDTIEVTRDDNWKERAPKPPEGLVWKTSTKSSNLAIFLVVFFFIVPITASLILSNQPWSEKGIPGVVMLLFTSAVAAIVAISSRRARASLGLSAEELSVHTSKASWRGAWTAVQATRVESERLKQTRLYHLWLKRDDVWHDYSLGTVEDEAVEVLRRWHEWHARGREGLDVLLDVRKTL